MILIPSKWIWVERLFLRGGNEVRKRYFMDVEDPLPQGRDWLPKVHQFGLNHNGSDQPTTWDKRNYRN